MPRCKRDQRLLEKRNRKIAARYYYWTEIQRLRSDDAIRQLAEEEFFISEATILQILRKMQRLGDDELRKMVHLRGPMAKPPKITAEMLSLMPDKLNK
jgi:hypothetical protein